MGALFARRRSSQPEHSLGFATIDRIGAEGTMNSKIF